MFHRLQAHNKIAVILRVCYKIISIYQVILHTLYITFDPCFKHFK